MLARQPAQPRLGVRGPANAGACLQRQRAPLGLVGHTHVPSAWSTRADGAVQPVRIRADSRLDISAGKWLLNPGAVGAPLPATGGWWQALESHARAGAWWLELDLDAHRATWRRAPFDPAPARQRACALGLADACRPVVARNS